MDIKQREEIINELANEARDRITSGVLIKNVKSFFVLRGLSEKIAESITRIGEIRANEFLAEKEI